MFKATLNSVGGISVGKAALLPLNLMSPPILGSSTWEADTVFDFNFSDIKNHFWQKDLKDYNCTFVEAVDFTGEVVPFAILKKNDRAVSGKYFGITERAPFIIVDNYNGSGNAVVFCISSNGIGNGQIDTYELNGSLDDVITALEATNA